MNTQKSTIPYLVILGLVVAGCFLISPAAPAGEIPSGSDAEIRQLLAQVKTEAIALEHDADSLFAWARAKQVSSRSHSESLISMKDHINEAGKLLAKLHEARDTASPWQQQAIDRMYPLLKELADNTQAMINHFNEDKAHIGFAAYEDYAKAGYGLAKELASLISNYVDYGDQEAEFHRLQEKLQLTAS